MPLRLTPKGEDLIVHIVSEYLASAITAVSPDAFLAFSVHVIAQEWVLANSAAFVGSTAVEIVGVSAANAATGVAALNDDDAFNAFAASNSAGLVNVLSITANADAETDATPTKDAEVDLVDFRCANGASIPLSQVCDQVKNCADGEDELFC